MTMDIDPGVEVADWVQFNRLSDALLETGNFSTTREKQSLLYGDIAIDLVPFGSVVEEGEK